MTASDWFFDDCIDTRYTSPDYQAKQEAEYQAQLADSNSFLTRMLEAQTHTTSEYVAKQNAEYDNSFSDMLENQSTNLEESSPPEVFSRLPNGTVIYLTDDGFLDEQGVSYTLDYKETGEEIFNKL